MPSLINSVLALRDWRHRRAFDDATRDPEEAQRRVLRHIIGRNRSTAFGQDHAFGDVRSPGDYARRLPIREYEALRPYVDRLLAGETNVLTDEPPLMFATTSGTTGEPKHIPVTRGWARSMAGLMRLWALRAVSDHPGLLAHRILAIVSPAVEGRTPGGLPFGSMSGLTYARLPWLIRRQHVLPYAAALIRDYDTRYFLMARGWSERLCRAEFAHGLREHQHKWKAVALEWDEASRLDVARTEDLIAEVSGHA